MNLSAVIPTLNEEENIGPLIKKLQNCKSIKQIIVVDCNSEDKTREIAKSLGAVVTTSPIKGVGYQRNLGAKLARCETVIFFDADVSFSDDFIDNLTKKFKARNLDLACPIFISKSDNVFVNILHYLFSFIFLITQKILPSGAGPCIITNRDFFIRCGGFDDQLVFEDIEFIRRAAKQGRYGVINEKIVVSDRRFINQGVLKMIAIYTTISFLFLFGAFKAANAINYWGENNGHRKNSKQKKS